ncbi:MAG: alpha-glucosidase [Halobacteriales archaeon]|nr:alpha-glucosidase [Halobacteriales archaeon]
MDVGRRDLLRLVGVGALGGMVLLDETETVSAGELTSDAEARRFGLGRFALDWHKTEEGYALSVEDDGETVWRTVPGESFLEAADAEFEAEHRQGPYEITEDVRRTRAEQHVETFEEDGDSVTVAGTLSDGDETVGYELTVENTDEEHLRFTLTTDTSGDVRLGLRYASSADERFHGFGEQARHLDLKGRQVPVLTQEPGIGRDHVVNEFLVEAVSPGSSGTTVSSYAPMPYYLSDKGYSLFLENTAYSVFDLRAENLASVRCYDDELVWRVIGGETPAERVESFSRYTGRMPALPDWMHEGGVVGMQGGTERVREVWEELQERDTPLAGFWLQDWVGARTTSFGEQLWWNWELDRDRYPGWDELVSDLNDEGVEVLGYVSPYITDVSEKENVRRNLFKEARENGYLVEQDGEVFMLPITDFSAALVDLTNPEARDWIRDVIDENLLGNGFRGWMADFGEGFPFDAELHDDTIEPSEYHNRYVVDWAEVNREAIEEEGREDAVFFTRSGFTRSPAHSTLFWTGDQFVSWDDRDGFQTSVRALLTSGVSGISHNHFDAGGYTSIVRGPVGSGRGRELLLRWLEAAAFTAVYRTHEGNQPDENAQIYNDSGTYDQFARFAKVYASLAPYRKHVCAEAEERGLPVVRPLFLHYPDDETAREIHTQFLLGREILVAPVVEKGARDRRVYLPDDEWTHLWTGDAYEEGWHSLDAPVGEPPAFYRSEAADRMEPVLENLRENGVLE